MDKVVALARMWVGTPYVHQASKRGAGADCLGLIRGVWRELYGREPEPIPAYCVDWGECHGREILHDAVARHFMPVSAPDIDAGQVLLFRMRQGAVAKHLGIAATGGAGPSFIHAYDRRGVVESPLSAPWRGRIVARFRFP